MDTQTLPRFEMSPADGGLSALQITAERLGLCPVCGTKKTMMEQYVGGKGYTTRLVCPVKWASDDDTCGKEAGR